MTLEMLIAEARALPPSQRRVLIDSIRDSLNESGEKLHDIMEFEGIGAELWAGVDVQAYLNEMRDEWDKK